MKKKVKVFLIIITFMIILSILILGFNNPPIYKGNFSWNNEVKFEEVKKIRVNINNSFPFSYLIKYNNYYLLNNSNCEIFLVNNKGEVVSKIGGNGKAPGEFGSINRIVCHDSLILVYDNSNLRITLLQIKNDKLLFVRTAKVDFYISGITFGNDNEIYLSKKIPEINSFNIISVYDLNLKFKGELINSTNKYKKMEDITKNLENYIYVKDNILYIFYRYIGKLDCFDIKNNFKLINTLDLKIKEYSPIFIKSREGFSTCLQSDGIRSMYLLNDYIISQYPILISKDEKNNKVFIWAIFNKKGETIGKFILNDKKYLSDIIISDKILNIEYYYNGYIYTLKRITKLPGE